MPFFMTFLMNLDVIVRSTDHKFDIQMDRSKVRRTDEIQMYLRFNIDLICNINAIQMQYRYNSHETNMQPRLKLDATQRQPR